MDGERAITGARKSYMRSPPRARRQGVSYAWRMATSFSIIDSMWQMKKISAVIALRKP